MTQETFAIEAILHFAGKMASNIRAIIDPLVQFYKDCLERAEQRIWLLEMQYEEVKAERQQLQRQYDTLEEWATSQEFRANALHDVIDGFITRETTASIRRDLLEAFNEVANELDIDMGDVHQPFEEIDLTSDSD